MKDYGFGTANYKSSRAKEEDISDVSNLLQNNGQQRRGNLSKSDVMEQPIEVTLEKFRTIQFPNNPEPKLKIYFSDYDKPYISNKTNIEILAMIFQSTDLKDWEGGKVMFYYDPDIEMEDQVVGGVRICEPDNLPEHVVDYYETKDAK